MAQLDPPELLCVFVDEDGNVVVNWQPPSDPGGDFDTFHLWVADPVNLIWNEIILNDFSATSFVDTGSSPEIQSFCYFMTTESTDGLLSISSDTLCTILLDAIPSVSPPGYANLSWTSPYIFSTPPGGAFYQLLMEYPVGFWNQLATVPFGQDEYLQEITVCNEFLNFQVVLIAPDGCEIASNIDGDVFADSTPPTIPVVTSVSIDLATHDAIISWLPSESQDTQAYIVYQCLGSFVTVIDTVYGINNTQFTDLLAQGNFGPEGYLVAAFDTCYSGSPPSPNTSPTGDVCNNSIFLTSEFFVECDDNITLDWTPYEGWVLGVLEYVIMHSIDNVFFSPIDTVPGSVLTYDHPDPMPGILHYYYIVAHAEAFPYEANSNLRPVPAPYPETPDYIYTSSATVTGKNEVTIIALITPTTDIVHYHLERKEVNDDEWDEVIVQDFNNASMINFIDNNNINPSVFSYTYRVIAENLCGDMVDTSNIGKTILLQGLANNNRLVNTLTWSNYEDWQTGVELYRVYRSQDDGTTQELLAELNSNVDFYEDDVSHLLYTEGEYCYTVEAVESTNSFGVSSSANSNELCLTQVPKIWIPNAFMPGGVNDVFRPVISFADFEQYRMVIFSRWGDMVFETEDVNEGWDGRYKGELVQEGSFAFYVGVRDGDGRLYENTGFVIMLASGGN
ncbi:MAG: gliding motility-associated C-terminal domain-containing protein [Flavobacteriales bacterium]|nr:gliding motility-associated C-terminal domain-containing protein [Flavobacteriales bacterium]